MEEHFNAIILKIVKYSDKTQIADMLTENHGRMSFAVPAPSRSKSRSKTRTIWRPLNMIEFECDVHKRKGLPRPKDVGITYNYSDMTYNPVKAMIAMYVNELLCSALWGDVPDQPLFHFVRQSLVLLDKKQDKFINFHITFALNLLELIGIQPNMNRTDIDSFFDMRAAVFTPLHPLHPDVLSDNEADALQILMRINFNNMHHFRFTRQQIQRILHLINTYYMIHIPNFQQLKSTEIFHNALS